MSGQPIASTQLQVRYQECDPSRIAFNANYLAWAAMGFSDCLHAVLGSYAHVTEQGLELVVADSSLRFRSPARPGDDLTITSFLDHLGRTSLVFRFEMRKADGLVAEVTSRYVWVSGDTVKPTLPPEDISTKFLAYAVAE